MTHRRPCPCNDDDPRSESQYEESQWTIETVKSKHGIWIVTLDPPINLIHPVLNLWNEKMKKCVPSLRKEDHKEITIDSVSLRDCLDAGYRILKTHCLLEFHLEESLWREATLLGVVEKTINSSNAPENKEQFLEDWDSKFPGIAQYFEDRWDRWGKNPALKFAAKIKLNSMWGKHAERLNLPSTQIFDMREDRDEIDTLWANILGRGTNFQQATVLNDSTILYKTTKRDSRLNTHKGYLPAALMIPAYGRSQLWREMNKVRNLIYTQIS
jgi:hypothetical protein